MLNTNFRSHMKNETTKTCILQYTPTLYTLQTLCAFSSSQWVSEITPTSPSHTHPTAHLGQWPGGRTDPVGQVLSPGLRGRGFVPCTSPSAASRTTYPEKAVVAPLPPATYPTPPHLTPPHPHPGGCLGSHAASHTLLALANDGFQTRRG